MLRFIKVLLVLLVLGFVGLVGFAYFGDMDPVREEIVQPVELDEG